MPACLCCSLPCADREAEANRADQAEAGPAARAAPPGKRARVLSVPAGLPLALRVNVFPKWGIYDSVGRGPRLCL